MAEGRWLCLFFALLLLSLPGAVGDGIPVPLTPIAEIHDQITEDLQIVRVDVNRTHQSTYLFVAIRPLSLHDRNISLVVPMTEPPEAVHGMIMRTGDFMKGYGLIEAEKEASERNMTRGLSNTRAYLDFFRRGSLLSMLVPMGSLVALREAGEGYRYSWGSGWRGKGIDVGLPKRVAEYRFHGVSMEVYRFETYESLQSLMSSLGANLPQGVEEALQRYSMNHAAVITLEIKSPLGRDAADLLAEKCPRTVESFFRWLAEGRPEDEIGSDPPPAIWEGQFVAYHFAQKAEDEASGSSAEDIDRIERAIFQLVRSYLSLPEKGYLLQYTNELHHGIWYPLGTSSAWSLPVGLTEVLVRLTGDPGLWLENPEPRPQAIYTSSSGRCFFWRLTRSNPSSDLEGSIGQGHPGFPLMLGNILAIMLNRGHRWIAGLLNVAVLCLIWLASTEAVGLAMSSGRRPGVKTRLTRAGLGILTYFFSVFSVLVPIPILYLRLRGRGVRDGPIRSFLFLTILLIIPLLLFALIAFLIGTAAALGAYMAIIGGLIGMLIVALTLFLIVAIDTVMARLIRSGPRASAIHTAKFWTYASILAVGLTVTYWESLTLGFFSLLLVLAASIIKTRVPRQAGVRGL